MTRPTTRQFVAAVVSTTQRYHDGLIVRQTFKTHMRALWGAIEQTPQMKARVNAELRRRAFTLLQGGAR